MATTTANEQRIKIELSPKQREFFVSTAPTTGYIGGIGSGKTFVGARWAFRMAMEYPGCVGMICANTYQQLSQSTLAPFVAFLTDLGIDYVFGSRPPWYKSRFKDCKGIFSFPNGTQILTRSLDNPEPIRGVEVGWLWCDETRDTTIDAWNVVVGRVRDKRGPLYIRITSSPNGYDWMYSMFIDDVVERPALRSQRHFVNTSIYENAANLPLGYIERMESLYGEDLAKQELGGLFINIGVGQVYSAFVREVHVRGDIAYDCDQPLYLGCDFNVSPMAWIVGQNKTIDGRLCDVAIDEIIRQSPRPGVPQTQSTVADFLAKYRHHRGYVYIYGDYYGTSQSTKTSKSDYDIIMDALRPVFRERVRLMVRDTATSSQVPGGVVNRVNLVNARLRNVRGDVSAYVAPSCKELIADLEQVAWKEVSGERKIDKTRDMKRTHASDAWGYLLFGVNIARGTVAPSAARRATFDTTGFSPAPTRNNGDMWR